MPLPKPPSRVDGVATPLFGLCWYGDPGNGTSIIAHCGGGGSAATGVNNMVTVTIAGEENDLVISTGDQVGVGICIVKNPLTNRLRMFVALGKKVHVYALPSGDLEDEVSVGDGVNAIAVNSMASQLAAGCESGAVKVFDIVDDKVDELPKHTLEGHTKAVAAVAFSPRENKLVSSAKDGTARVWKGEDCLSELVCSIDDPKGPKPKRKMQVLVRGCAFGDLMGNLVYTVASGRKGKAFISKWGCPNGKGPYNLIDRTDCSPWPVSSMNLSGDGGLVALGAVDGTVLLWSTERWRVMKKFFEVHGLPVTCIAARPFPVPLKGDEENGAEMHAISASADSQMAYLTMERAKWKRQPSDMTFQTFINSLVKFAIIGWLLFPLVNEIQTKCESDFHEHGLRKTLECIHHDVLIAPSTRPGIDVAPY